MFCVIVVANWEKTDGGVVVSGNRDGGVASLSNLAISIIISTMTDYCEANDFWIILNASACDFCIISNAFACCWTVSQKESSFNEVES